MKRANLRRLRSWEGMKYVYCDCSDEGMVLQCLNEQLMRMQANVCGIVHAAAVSGVGNSVEDPLIALRANSLSTVLLLELVKRLGEEANASDVNFVLCSSGATYGDNNSTLRKVPSRETDGLMTPEKSPTSPYTSSKIAAKAACHAFRGIRGIGKISICRLFTMYGPRG